MIDFQNASFLKLRTAPKGKFDSIVWPLLVVGEEVIQSFCGIRDGVVFTNNRLIAINVQGISGKKKDITSLPYNKIQAFSIETAGTLDLDCELDLWFSGLGKVRFEFVSGVDVYQVCKLISERVF